VADALRELGYRIGYKRVAAIWATRNQPSNISAIWPDS
jgi:hypothetical protein